MSRSRLPLCLCVCVCVESETQTLLFLESTSTVGLRPDRILSQRESVIKSHEPLRPDVTRPRALEGPNAQIPLPARPPVEWRPRSPRARKASPRWAVHGSTGVLKGALYLAGERPEMTKSRHRICYCAIRPEASALQVLEASDTAPMEHEMVKVPVYLGKPSSISCGSFWLSVSSLIL